MNNEKYQQIIDEVWKKYGDSHWTPPSNPNGKLLSEQLWSLKPMMHNKESFINKCKTDPEFSEKWGLKIEERELSEKERIVLSGYDYENRGGIGWNMLKETVDMDNSIPTKLITITYNNETIEIYE